MEGLLSQLEMAVMERIGEGTFRLTEPPPDWLERFFPDARKAGDRLMPGETFPFIENFLFDAEAFWAAGKGGRLKSGSWIETGASGTEYALEATALEVDGRKALLLEWLGDAYEHQKQALQSARESLLIRGYLEEEVRRRTADIRNREEEIALRLVWASESRDEETGAHIRRLGRFSEAIARALGWPPDRVDDIRIAATMHDIGKIGIPDRILLKQAQLSFEEYEIMKAHTKIGANILDSSQVPLLKMARQIALCHHERWDGSGYPRGLKGEEIPESARITTVADIFDALIHKRVYKPPFDEEKALGIMTEESGTTFDPRIFDCFLRILPEIRKISRTVQ